MAFTTSIPALLDKYGQEYTLKIITTSGISFSDPTAGPTETSTSYTITGYPSRYKQEKIDETLIKSEDIRLFTSDLDVVPSQDDQILKGDTVYNIIKVRPYYVSSDIPLYEMQIRS